MRQKEIENRNENENNYLDMNTRKLTFADKITSRLNGSKVHTDIPCLKINLQKIIQDIQNED